jgi:hypothetical protein
LGCTEDSVDFASGTLTGTVREISTNEPLDNVKITTSPSTETVYTDEEGTFEIVESIPTGDYSVKAELSGFVSEFEAITIKEFDQSVSVAFELTKDESLNSPPEIPELLAPENLATGLNNSVTLKWSSSDVDEDSLTYQVVVHNNSSNSEEEYNNLHQDTLLLDNLTFGTTYTWQVSVSDSINAKVFSESHQFTIRQNPEYAYHFTRLINDNYVIYATNLEEIISITEVSNSSWRPHKYNIAQKLAFLQTSAGQINLVTSNLNGTNQQRINQVPITGFRDKLIDFSWNTDGSKFIFPSLDKLYKVNADGTGQEIIYQSTDGAFITKCAWSYDSSKIAIVTNNNDGYDGKINILDASGNWLQTILENQPGALGGIDWNITGDKLVYTYDVSDYQSDNYRQLEMDIFIYDFNDDEHLNISEMTSKPDGTNDIDPRFSPNDAQLIFSNSSNALFSEKSIYTIKLANLSDSREQLITNGEMPDYK